MNYASKIRPLATLVFTVVSTGCTTLPTFNGTDYVDPIDGAQVIDNRTRYSRPLECMRPIMKSSAAADKRFAVGRVSDFTGKEDLTNGKRITQGASLMVMSALSRAGATLVERFDTTIADIEIKYADNKLITDNPETRAYRKLMSGSIPGSDYHVVGGITEINYNIRSGAFDSSIKFVGLGARYFVMNVAVDLRLVNTKTLEVVNNQSLQKQIIGTELSAGYFRIFNSANVDITASERTQEPIQRGVRMVIEQAVFNMLNETHSLNANHCLGAANTKTTTEPAVAQTPEPTPQAAPAATAAEPAPAVMPTAAAPAEATRPARQQADPSSTGVIETGAALSQEQPRATVSPTGRSISRRPVRSVAQASKTPENTPAQSGQQGQPEDSGLFSGLIGGDSQETSATAQSVASNDSAPTAKTNSNADSSPPKTEMQEKLLWGSEPFIR